MDCIKSRYPLSIVDEYEFRLVLNELIANGTIHGNKRLGDKTITAQIDAIDKYTVGNCKRIVTKKRYSVKRKPIY